ncbi:unnamed protein product [Cyclocybe aegerita]|uniref:Cytochrome P450 n=1 Tax=Cyclocybe aegerita TaxID=1973307 RepID=A0A8S0VSG7_CYCAE|nr:unnamed protein product [Cyclocybe aegerita]
MPHPLSETLSLTVLLVAGWLFLRRRRHRTVLDNIPGPQARSWTTGSLDDIWNRRGWDYHRKIAETYGSILRVKGLFGANDLYIFDPKALQHILIKGQDIFEETETFLETNKIIYGDGIFTTLGDRHHHQRKMLNSIFSIAHLREMVPIFYGVTSRLRKTFSTLTQSGPAEVDILVWTTRLSLELIGQAGLGYTFDDLEQGSVPHAYGLASKELLPLVAEASALMRNPLVPYIARMGPPRFRRFLVDWLPIKQIHRVRNIVDTLHNTSVEIYEAKKQALEQGDAALAAQSGGGKDIITNLMKANLRTSDDDKLSEKEILGQITSLTFAATDTTSSALCRTIHLLSIHKDVQKRLREEIRSARDSAGGEDLSYDTFMSLPYLDAICKETLRLYPPIATFMRNARQDAILPLSAPIKGIDGTDFHEIHVPKGTDVFVSVISSNRNPQVWGPDAYEWNPERWLQPLPESVLNARIPGVLPHLLTFFAGGRSCIGFKFAQLEMKVVLTLLVEGFEFSPSVDKDIVWQMTSITTPNLDFESTVPTLPIIITRAA